MAGEESLVYQKIIKAPVEQIFRAFTTSTALREWLCDFATSNPVEGGRIYLAWNKQFFASGSFTRLTPNQVVEFTWIGKDEPSWTNVIITIKTLDADRGCLVELRHSGLGNTTNWDVAREEIAAGWEIGLENLRSTLEEGIDIRLLQRPLIGIYPEDVANLNQETKKNLEIPVDYGVLVLGTLEGYGGEKAGLKPDDVIVGINGEKVETVRMLATINSQFLPGDQINVEAFRRNERKTFVIKTMSQSFVDLPETPEDLAREVEEKSLQVLEALDSVLEGISESEASFAPGAEEWSVKDILGHLIHSERELHDWINDLVAGQERMQDEWPGNQLFRIRAVLTCYPTLDELLNELRCSLKETVASIAFIDPSFTNRKASYRRLVNDLLGYSRHFEEHIQQIVENIKVARASKS